MKFTANRKIMLEYLKSMARVVPKSSPNKEMTGFLVEANEDDGYVYVTANNGETAMQRKFKPNVETGGEFVIDAGFLINALSLLGGTDVLFEETKPGRVKIKSENCFYEMATLNGRIYPRPEMPFPDDMVKITGLKQLYSKTAATVTTGKETDVKTGIHLEISESGVKAMSCNDQSIAITSIEMDCGGKMEFTLPKTTLFHLASAVGNDDELDVGLSGPFIVFMKQDLIFSAKQLSKNYVDVNTLLAAVQPEYRAKVEFDDFKETLLGMCEVAAMGSETSYIKLDFKGEKVEVSTQNDIGGSASAFSAVRINGEKDYTFYFPAKKLANIFKTVEGTLIIMLDPRGYLVVFDRYSQYMTMAVREEAAIKQQEKYATQKKTKREKQKVAETTETKAA